MSDKTEKTDIVRVEIYYVPDDKVSDAWPKCLVGDVGGFLPVEDLELIDTPGLQRVTNRPVGHPRVLESVYSSYQRLDGDPQKERVEQLKRRSMSVGDAIVIDKQAYYVASEGFITLVDGKLVPVEAS
jgi:hypothetical protein